MGKMSQTPGFPEEHSALPDRNSGEGGGSQTYCSLQKQQKVLDSWVSWQESNERSSGCQGYPRGSSEPRDGHGSGGDPGCLSSLFSEGQWGVSDPLFPEWYLPGNDRRAAQSILGSLEDKRSLGCLGPLDVIGRSLMPDFLEGNSRVPLRGGGGRCQWGNVVSLSPGDTSLHGSRGGTAGWGAKPEVQVNDWPQQAQAGFLLQVALPLTTECQDRP